MKSYTQDDYAKAWLQLLPPGKAFDRSSDSNFYKLAYSMMKQFKDVDDAGLNLVDDMHPSTTNFLAEWQASLGLPDKCVSYSSSFEDQRSQVVSRLTFTGGSTTAFLKQFCEGLGYSVDIKEWGEAICGASVCNMQACGPADHQNESVLTINILGSKDTSLLMCEIKPFIPPYLTVLFFNNNKIIQQ
ncbi:putative phage tail protein [Gluconobacter sp. OJB]|uniref:putative phage tail protein n=1 Tax=Gluconobacter sp. OJB TaxID=3145196 RepID=UPI0031F8E6D7